MANAASHQHILVIRLSAMGDVAMAVPVLLALTQNNPGLQITLLTKAGFNPIFNALPNISVFPVDVKKEYKGLIGIFKLFGQLKKLPFDAVADLHNVIRSKVLVALFRLKGVKTMQLDKGRKEKKRLTREKKKVFTPLRSTVERYKQVFLNLGFQFPKEGRFFLPKEQVSGIALSFLPKAQPIKIGIAPFATYPGKMYHLDLLKEVMNKLLNVVDSSLFLFGGGQKEIEKLKELEANFESNVYCIAGTMTFEEELTFISNLDIMLAMDSGNGHLAANYGVPVVTIWGVTHPYAGFLPYGQPIENSLLPDRNTYPLIPTSVSNGV